MNTGGPAFPQDVAYLTHGQNYLNRGPQGGMTLRDYFAAKAMQGMCFDPDQWPQEKNMLLMATISYQVADAMLKAREQ